MYFLEFGSEGANGLSRWKKSWLGGDLGDLKYEPQPLWQGIGASGITGWEVGTHSLALLGKMVLVCAQAAGL